MRGIIHRVKFSPMMAMMEKPGRPQVRAAGAKRGITYTGPPPAIEGTSVTSSPSWKR